MILGVTPDVVLDWRLELLTTLTRLVATLNYSAISDLHTLQITTAHAKLEVKSKG
jgi:hypothetical protein